KESFGDDADDEEEDEEEEHLAPADTFPPPAYRTTTRLLAISTPPSSPLTSYSSPLPQIPSPPLPVSPPALPASPTHPLGYRAAMIQLRAESPSTSHPLPIILPHTRESMAMMRAAAPSTYILASRSETPPSGTPPLLPIPLPTHRHLCSYPLLTIERTGPRFVYHLGRGYVLLLVLGMRLERARLLLLLDRLEVLGQTMVLLPL
ncbi:hypothetical protein Tco_0219232, partial [Tanacetum coccineum]